MKNFKHLLLSILLLIPMLLLGQQSVEVKGVVLDELGMPLIGVSVVEEGTTNGSMTDIDGHYLLNLQKPDPSISFSFIGFTKKTVKVNQQATINITLMEESSYLDEIVVVGYGVQKKVNLSGSVVSVDFSDAIKGRPTMNVSSALGGLIPGLNATQSSGQPGSDGATIRIRGTGSFGLGSDPLVLVDGVEWNMNNINPHDVENISVLKDAASTAIYGSRGANGVILITTKKGKGKPNISYSFSGIVQKPYSDLKFINDYSRYMGLVNEATENMGTSNLFSKNSIDEWIAASQNPHGVNKYGVPNYVAYPNTDWFDEIFHTGFSQEHNVSISGGADKTSYLISLGYLDNQGVMNRWNLNSSTQKYNFRVNLETEPLSWLKVGTRIFGQKQDYGMANISNGFKYLYQTTPGIYPGEPDYWGIPALTSEESTNANNLFRQMAGGTGYNKAFRLNTSMYAIVSPYKGVSLEGTFNYSPIFTDRSSYSRKNGSWNYVEDIRSSNTVLENATITNRSGREYNQSVELLARYNTTLYKDHEIGAIFGFSAKQTFGKAFSVTKRGATDWVLHDLNTYQLLESAGSNSIAKDGLLSYFGRINYGYKQRYLFEANLRYDGSSRFGKDERWASFPSFSGAWRISEENFMENTKSYLSNLKLRLSWGQVGNNGIPIYKWQSTYSSGNVVVDGNPQTGLFVDELGNNKLKWETSTTTNIGLDFGFFNNRLTAEVDLYNKKTTDILYTPSLYLSMGNVNPSPDNIGAMYNRGVELSLAWNGNIGKDISYHINSNFSYNKNKITSFLGQLEKYWTYDEFGNKVSYVNNFAQVSSGRVGGYLTENKQYGEYYIHKVYGGTGEGYTGGAVDIKAGPKDGMIRTEEDMRWVQAMLDSGYSFGGMKTIGKDQLWYGDILYDDVNGDMNYGNDDDKTFNGHSATPKYNLGINLGISYKDFDLSMTWAGAMGFHLLWNDNYYNSTLVSHGHGIIEHIANDHYFYDPKTPNDPRTNLTGHFPRLTYGTTFNNRSSSNFYLYKGDYLKLKNAQIGYTVPKKITQKLFISKLRAYVSMQNILTITDYPGQDPEKGTEIGYPLMRQISFGTQITF